MKIYVIGNHGKPLKIGISKNPEQRLKELQTGCYFKLKLLHEEPLRHPACERVVHHYLDGCRTHGEWFDTTLESAIIHIRNATEFLLENDTK